VQRLPTLLQKLDGAKRLAILGIGSELRADDIAGILVAKRIKKLAAGRKSPVKLKILEGGTAPENLTGELKRFKPTHLVIIDAADLGEKPGRIAVMEPDNVSGVSFCTHSLPIKVMTDYLLQSFPCQVTLIGIQPKTLEVGASPSQEVLEAVDMVAAMIASALHDDKPR
jgi:hydrogenase 3 maturation protease